jgi:hypothetical protein
MGLSGHVGVVAKDQDHRLSKEGASEMTVIAGLCAEGDVHQGISVKHRSRAAADHG